MNTATLFNLSYGLYIIGTKDEQKNIGCVVNTVTQATSKPITLTVCINKDNYTNECIKKSKEFSVSILSESTKESTFGLFGFHSSRERDKFAEVPFGLTPDGLPYIDEGTVGWLQCKVIDFVDNYTHTVFIAEVTDAENLCNEPPMTYAYYHNVVKGKTPPKAPSYAGNEDNAGDSESTASGSQYVCDFCGYIYPGSAAEFEQLPDDYVCPICGVDKSYFNLQ